MNQQEIKKGVARQIFSFNSSRMGLYSRTPASRAACTTWNLQPVPCATICRIVPSGYNTYKTCHSEAKSFLCRRSFASKKNFTFFVTIFRIGRFLLHEGNLCSAACAAGGEYSQKLLLTNRNHYVMLPIRHFM